MCNGNELRNFGTAQLKAPLNALNLKLGTANYSAEDDLKKCEKVYKGRRSKR